MAANEIYQFSVVSALMDGVASDGLPLSQLLAHGDHGLGTFRGMEGELIILDGQIFQMRHDGSVHPAKVAGVDGITPAEEDITPFAMITRFSAERHTRTRIREKDGVQPVLASLCPDARNTHIAFRIEGTFRTITVRTAEGQCYPGEGLKSVVSRQVTQTLGPLKGTVIGFRSPAFLQGVAVAGVHMHFIDDERRAGGHVLALESDGEVDIAVAETWRTVMDLPRNRQFNEAEMTLDDAGIKSAEG